MLLIFFPPNLFDFYAHILPYDTSTHLPSRLICDLFGAELDQKPLETLDRG